MTKTKGKLDFTPLTQIEVDALLLTLTPPPKGKVTSFKVNSWYDHNTKAFEYGISGKDDTGKWRFVCDGKRALIFTDKKTANKVCREFKALLTTIA